MDAAGAAVDRRRGQASDRVASGIRRPRLQRKTEILELFTEMVAKQGYDLTSISDLAGELNLSKGLIIYHFGSKDRLLQAMAESYMLRRLEELNVLIKEVDSSLYRLQLLIYSLVLAHLEDRAATIAVSREFVRFAAEPFMTDVAALRSRYIGLVSGIVDEGVANGEVEPTDSRVVTLQLLGMCNWAWTWLRPEGRRTIEEVAHTFVQLASHGLVVDPDAAPMRKLVLPSAIVDLRQARAAVAR